MNSGANSGWLTAVGQTKSDNLLGLALNWIDVGKRRSASSGLWEPPLDVSLEALEKRAKFENEVLQKFRYIESKTYVGTRESSADYGKEWKLKLAMKVYREREISIFSFSKPQNNLEILKNIWDYKLEIRKLQS